MSRPEHLNTPNTPEGIRRINEAQEHYDKDPEAYEREAEAELEARGRYEEEMAAQAEAEYQGEMGAAQEAEYFANQGFEDTPNQ